MFNFFVTWQGWPATVFCELFASFFFSSWLHFSLCCGFVWQRRNCHLCSYVHIFPLGMYLLVSLYCCLVDLTFTAYHVCDSAWWSGSRVSEAIRNSQPSVSWCPTGAIREDWLHLLVFVHGGGLLLHGVCVCVCVCVFVCVWNGWREEERQTDGFMSQCSAVCDSGWEIVCLDVTSHIVPKKKWPLNVNSFYLEKHGKHLVFSWQCLQPSSMFRCRRGAVTFSSSTSSLCTSSPFSSWAVSRPESTSVSTALFACISSRKFPKTQARQSHDV